MLPDHFRRAVALSPNVRPPATKRDVLFHILFQYRIAVLFCISDLGASMFASLDWDQRVRAVAVMYKCRGDLWPTSDETTAYRRPVATALGDLPQFKNAHIDGIGGDDRSRLLLSCIGGFSNTAMRQSRDNQNRKLSAAMQKGAAAQEMAQAADARSKEAKALAQNSIAVQNIQMELISSQVADLERKMQAHVVADVEAGLTEKVRQAVEAAVQKVFQDQAVERIERDKALADLEAKEKTFKEQLSIWMKDRIKEQKTVIDEHFASRKSAFEKFVADAEARSAKADEPQTKKARKEKN